jgi:hypothetical protein
MDLLAGIALGFQAALTLFWGVIVSMWVRPAS